MKQIHSVTDKALNDALNQSQITLNEIRDLFLSRGILISKSTDRKVLSKNFSRMTHDYHDHQKLASLLGSITRKEKITSKRIIINNNSELLLSASNELSAKIIDEGDYCHVMTDKDGKVTLNIRYLTANYGKSEFKQFINKDAIIEIEPTDEGYSIRRPDNESMTDYEDSLLRYIEKEAQKIADESNSSEDISLNINEISLQHDTRPASRTLFFTKLITGLNGFVLDDVTDAYIFHPKPETIEDENGDVDIGVHISKASLKGEGVLKSEELISLYERGFYIWRVRWRVKENRPDPDIYEMEAQFNNQYEFKDFSYLVKSVKRYKGNGEYFKSTQSLTNNEEKKFNILIEDTAFSIISAISKIE